MGAAVLGPENEKYIEKITSLSPATQQTLSLVMKEVIDLTQQQGPTTPARERAFSTYSASSANVELNAEIQHLNEENSKLKDELRSLQQTLKTISAAQVLFG